MNPFLLQMLAGMQGTPALQPGFDASPAVAGAGGAPGGGNFADILGAVQPPQPDKPIMSGGVSGVGASPFLQQMPDILTGALQGAFSRQNQGSTMPSLGALLAGGR